MRIPLRDDSLLSGVDDFDFFVVSGDSQQRAIEIPLKALRNAVDVDRVLHYASLHIPDLHGLVVRGGGEHPTR